MASNYDASLALLDELADSDALDNAVDAMSFIQVLHQNLVENGAKLSEEPDADEIGTVLDGIFAELAAVSLFLSEPSFARVPDMMRKIADGIEALDKPFTDPTGQTAKSVPPAVVNGFRNFATRLEATRVQKQQLIGQLKKVDA